MKPRRVIVSSAFLALAVLAGCSSGASTGPADTPTPSSTQSAAAWPTAGIDGWVWGEASEADVALVDAVLKAVSTDDIEALDDRYASNATQMTSWQISSCDRDCILALSRKTTNTYVRVGGVYAVTYHGSGSKLPADSRYVFFTMVIHRDIFDCWFEVNADGQIVNQWVGWKKV